MFNINKLSEFLDVPAEFTGDVKAQVIECKGVKQALNYLSVLKLPKETEVDNRKVVFIVVDENQWS